MQNLNVWRASGLSFALATLSLAFACSSDTTKEPGDENDAGALAVRSPDGGAVDLSGRSVIFATVSSSHEVVALDQSTHVELASFTVGAGPAILLNTPDNAQLYTANWGDKNVSQIDLKTHAVSTIAMPGRPYVIAMSPDGKSVYAGCDGGNTIQVIDTATHAVTRSIQMNFLPASLIVSPDNKTLYVASIGLGIGAGSLYAFDAASGNMTQPALTVGMSPAWITIGKDGSRVYTLNFLSDDVTVVNTQSWTVEATIKTGTGSQGIIGNVSPDGSRLYVTNFGTGSLVAIDTASNQLVQTIMLTGKPVGVNFDSSGHVYTTDFGVGSLNDGIGTGITYITSGTYNGTSPGQVREFEISTGNEVGTTAMTAPGPTSVVVLTAPASSK